MKFFKRFFFAALLLMPVLSLAQIKEAAIYNRWYSDVSDFKPDRPFVVINDYDSFTELWQKAHIQGALPTLDFEKYMLLVWAPGKTMYDCANIKLKRFVFKNGAYVAVYNFNKKISSSVWHSPLVATVLPKLCGDIFIQSEKITDRKLQYTTVYTLWNMKGKRTQPFNTVGLETTDNSQIKLITAQKTKEARPQKSAVRLDIPIEQTLSEQPKPVLQKNSAPVQQSAPQKIESNPFAFKQQASQTNKANSLQQKPALPAFEEDPLFGSEFDIEF